MQLKLWPLLLTLLLLGGCDEGPAPVTAPAVTEATANNTAVNQPVGNVEAGKKLAERCARCHGINGVSARSGSPFIAGLEQDYLIRSLLAYKDGSRKNIPMFTAVKDLTPTQLSDLTAWYASLDTPWKGAVADAESRAILRDKAARSAAITSAPGCDSCHNRAAIYKQNQAIPSLNGMPLEYFVPSLKAYLNGTRQDPIMGQFKLSLSDKDIYNLGAYYAAQKPEKAPPATEGNPAKGKQAAHGCAGCHGYDGNSLNPHVPNLAGQTADYLRKSLKQYRDGTRQEALMREPVKHLSDSDIANLAAYYSQQQPESPLHKEISAAKSFDPLPEGKKIAATCDSCHDRPGTRGIPNLGGQHVRYLIAATSTYQSGQRQHQGMFDMVSFLSDTDIEKVAYHYATHPPRIPAKPASSDSANGEKLSHPCTGCHGKTGISDDPATTPNLAGQDPDYIISATLDYASGKRKHDNMAKMARETSSDDLKQIAAWFAAQTPVKMETWLPEEPAMIVEKRCSRCHGERGYSTTPGVPRLAGQSEPYIIVTMREYQDGTRKDSTMEAMAYGLSLIEIKAIAAYYARQ